MTCSMIPTTGSYREYIPITLSNVVRKSACSLTLPDENRLARIVEKGSHGLPVVIKSGDPPGQPCEESHWLAVA